MSNIDYFIPLFYKFHWGVILLTGELGLLLYMELDGIYMIVGVTLRVTMTRMVLNVSGLSFLSIGVALPVTMTLILRSIVTIFVS